MSTVNELMVIRFLFFIGSRWLRFIEDLDLKKIRILSLKRITITLNEIEN